ncbi:MAG: hypothetical protein RJQ09_05580 [Cyclobacteriaceae bacterium]
MEPRDFGGVINATFQFIIQEMGGLILAVTAIAGPLLFVEAILADGSPKEILDYIFRSSDYFWIFSSAALPAVVYDYIIIYNQCDGSPVTIPKIFQRFKKDVFLVILIHVLSFISMLVGFFLLIVPGILLTVYLSIWAITYLNEDVSFSESISRCFYLIKQNWWETLGVIFISVLIQYGLSFIIQSPLMIWAYLQDFFSVTDDSIGEEITFIQTIIMAVGGIINQMVSIISTVAITFQYFSLKEQKDATGLLKKIDSFGTNTDEVAEEY